MPEREFEREVLDRLTKIEVKLEYLEPSSKQIQDNASNIAILNEIIEQYDKRISDLENNNQWLQRTTAGAIIAALVGIITSFIN